MTNASKLKLPSAAEPAEKDPSCDIRQATADRVDSLGSRQDDTLKLLCAVLLVMIISMSREKKSIKMMIMMLVMLMMMLLVMLMLMPDNDFDDVYGLSSCRLLLWSPLHFSCCLSAGKCVNKKLLTAIFYTISACRSSL